MNPSRRKFAGFWSALVAVAFLASGCRVVGRIQEGQKVSMDPCKLIGLDKAQSVMGAPMNQQLNVRYKEDDGQPFFDGCGYRFSGSHEWSNLPNLHVEVVDMTRSTIGGTSLSKSLRNLGREARYEYDKPDSPHSDSHDRLRLAALTDKGALLELTFAAQRS